MSIADPNVVDAIGLDMQTENVILTISDHLDWREPVQTHLELLQDKLNTYLRFIESGEILESYPDAKDKSVVINIVGKYPLASAGEQFLSAAKSIVAEAGFSLTFELFKDSNSCLNGSSEDD